METEETAEATGGESPPRGQGGRPMPLNSRRVTGPILRSVAATLGLPTRASAEELRQMIDGRLEELGREPRDVLVVVERGNVETDEPGHVWLHDGEGPFLDGGLLPAEAPEGPSVSVGVAHAGAIVHGDRTPDREATLLAERDRLAADVERYRAEIESSRAELEKTRTEVTSVKKRLKEVWRMNCDQSISYDKELAAKDAVIAGLQGRLAATPLSDHLGAVPRGERHSLHSSTTSGGSRRGKAPPVDPFLGDDDIVRFDDWLPSLERAASWNSWGGWRKAPAAGWPPSWSSSPGVEPDSSRRQVDVH